MRWLVALVSAGLVLGSVPASAAFTVRDVGLVGLMSHDIFAWDHRQGVNLENGRLDLSTIFDYGGGRRWEKGGNPKNGENAPVYSVTMELVDFYRARLSAGVDAHEARAQTVARFHGMLQECYERVFDEPLPAAALREKPTNVDQASLRGLHDILPGRIALIGRALRRTLVLTHFTTAKTRLNAAELGQALKPFDGDYDPEFKAIRIPFTNAELNLMEIDRKFIESHSPYLQSEMLAELARVGRGELALGDVAFVGNVKRLFLKALCGEGNEFMPQGRVCL